MNKTQTRPKVAGATRWRTYSMMFVCGGVLTTGFFFAARQHFASMDFGMRNSRLRKQIDDLESEKRRLILARETSLSPVEIKKAAKKVGLIGSEEASAIIAQIASTAKDKAVSQMPSTAGTRPMIVKTAAVAAVQPISADYVRPGRIVKQVKKALGTD